MKEYLKTLNIPYKNIEIYNRALTHSSFANEHNIKNNERLEFLGDAILELLMSEYLFKDQKLTEGEMTVKRAQAVREEALVIYSLYINLDKHLKLGHGEQIKGPNNAILADAFEALLAAIYLDLGLNQARRMFNKIVVPNLDKAFNIIDFKSTLQEIIHSGTKRNISYKIIKESGPSHNKTFVANVLLDKEIILGTGEGKTKKEAEQKAAEEALKRGNRSEERRVGKACRCRS